MIDTGGFRTATHRVNRDGKRICASKIEAVVALDDAFEAVAAVKAWAGSIGFEVEPAVELHDELREPKALLGSLLTRLNLR